MLTEEVLSRAQRRLGAPAFAAAVARLRTEALDALERPVLVPPLDRPAGYYHDYFCPQHGVQLGFDWDSPRAHRCPVGGEVLRGDPFDRAWWWFVNHAHAEGAFRLALWWRLAGEAACLQRVADLFAAYAAHYPEAGWPAEDPRPRKGKVAFHALDEAVWLIPLAWTYHLVRGALPPDTRRTIEARLLRPAAEHLVAQRWPQVHNYVCWLNAAVAAAGTLLGRPDLHAQVINGPYGFRQQLVEGVLADGTWWEGSASYHFYTLTALLALVRSVPESHESRVKRQRHAGAQSTSPPIPLFSSAAAPPEAGTRGAQEVGVRAQHAALNAQHARLRDMFLAPLRWAYPDLSLPALNDCWYHSSLVGDCGHGIPGAAALYEIGLGWYGDPAFARVLTANYQRAGLPRDSLEALLYGPDDIPAPAANRLSVPRMLSASANLAELGVAVLRGRAKPAQAGTADSRTFLLLKYGPHGGGHGHPDKLGIILFGGGERLSPDLGTPGYGIALNDSWYRHTLSHNTVLLDGQPQSLATGRLLAFATPSGYRGRSSPAGSSAPHGPFGVIDAAVEWPALTQGQPSSADGHEDGRLGGEAAGPHAARRTPRSSSTLVLQHGSPSTVYAGVALRRTIFFRPTYFVDLVTVSCPAPRQIDWAYHNRGRLVQLIPTGERGARSAERETGRGRSSVLRRMPPSEPGIAPAMARASLAAQYAPLIGAGHLHLERAVRADQDLLAEFVTGSAGLRLWLAGVDLAGTDGMELSGGSTSMVVAARAPANPASESMALLLRRCRARAVRFAAVFHPYRTRPLVGAVTWWWAPDANAVACRIDTRRGSELWLIAATPAPYLAAAQRALGPVPGERVFQYALEAS